MVRPRWFLRRVATVSALVAAMTVGCAEERPLKPLPTELRIYVGAIDYSQAGPARSLMFVFDYDSLAVIDSFPLPALSVDAVAGNDGRSLFVVTANDLHTRSIWKYDIITKQPLWHHDLDRWVESPDGNGRIRSYSSGTQLLFNRTLLSTSAGTIIKTFPDTLVPLGGPANGTCIAIGSMPQGQILPTVLNGYDLSTDSTWGVYAPRLMSGAPLSVYTAELLEDGRRVLAIGPWRDLADSWFVIGDLESGETLFEYSLIYPFGEITILPGDSRAIVTDPSMTLIYDSYPTMDLFDLDGMRQLKRISWDPSSPSPFEKAVFTGQVAPVPGTEEIVVGAPGDFNSASSWMAITDFETLTVTRYFQIPGQREDFAYFMGGLAVGLTTKAGRGGPCE